MLISSVIVPSVTIPIISSIVKITSACAVPVIIMVIIGVIVLIIIIAVVIIHIIVIIISVIITIVIPIHSLTRFSILLFSPIVRIVILSSRPLIIVDVYKRQV